LYTATLLVLACVQSESLQEGAPPAAPVAPAAEAPSRWLDPEDGWFDLSSFLAEPHGFVPVLAPITEPALGYGLGGAAVFLDPREEAGAEGWARPNISAVGGMFTENGSDALFAGNSSTWADGDLQTLIGGGVGGLELELHGIGKDGALDHAPLDYGLDFKGALAEGRLRLGDSHFWTALRFAYAGVTVDFDGSPLGIEGLDPSDDDITIAGPAVSLRYDSLDNLFTPTRGTLSESTLSVFDEVFGGSQDFQLFQQILLHHWPLTESLFLGGRTEVELSFGDTPFYARPYIALRGLPALRYQGEHVASGELELRWQFHPRFSAVGFGGGGVAWTDLDDFERDQSALSGGVGGRYVISRRFGLHAGLDVAGGPEGGAIYVVFGNSWLRP
jgi:hypothetical protein